jgi:hypothetical protein
VSGRARTRVAACVLGALLLALAGCGSSSAPKRRAAQVLPASCAEHEPTQIAPNSWAPTKNKLAPVEASALRVCRYSGLNAHPALTLVRSALVTKASVVAKITNELDALHKQSGLVFCPADLGGEIVLLLAYPGDKADTISVGTSGCAGVTNGNLSRTASGFGSSVGPDLLLPELERLTGSSGG